MMRNILLCTAAAALVAAPVVALAGSSDSLNYPVRTLRPLQILTPTAALANGGSVVRVTVQVNTTGNQGFAAPALVTVCAGVSGCRAVSLRVTTGRTPTGVVSFPLQNVVQGPARVSLQVTAASTSYRSVLRNFTVTSR
jgi:hypothetical protein